MTIQQHLAGWMSLHQAAILAVAVDRGALTPKLAHNKDGGDCLLVVARHWPLAQGILIDATW